MDETVEERYFGAIYVADMDILITQRALTGTVCP